MILTTAACKEPKRAGEGKRVERFAKMHNIM
jgi:hypothetical protein